MIELPRKIIIDRNAIKNVADVCNSLGLGRKCLLLADKTTFKVAGEAVSKNLINHDFEVSTKIIDIVNKELAEEIAQKISKCFLVAVGGGKIIDIAKYISYNAGLQFISIPTAPSHDGIASDRAVINDSKSYYSFKVRPPTAIVADLEIISKTPYRLIASGCGDVISNIVAVEDWTLSKKVTGERFSDYAAAISLLAASNVLDSTETIKALKIDGIRNLVEALINSGIAMCIAGSSRPASGSEHLFSHALDRICLNKKSFHGEQCAVGTILMSYLHNLDWQRIRDALKSLGCPTNAHELGLSPEAVISALVEARNIRSDRYTILEQKKLNKNSAKELAKAVNVI